MPRHADLVTEAIALAEHRSNRERFRLIAQIGLAIWCALFAADMLMAWVVAPGPLWWYGAIRLLGTPMFLAVFRVTEADRELSPEGFRRWEAALLLTVAYGVSLMAAVGGGLTSPYITGIAATTVGHGVAIAQPWREALPVNVAILLGHPLILALAALFLPELAAQWRDPVAVGTLFVGMSLITALTVLATIGGHNHWSLRREALAARNVGRYELLASLGRGGMGEVWRARVRGTHQEVALKVLHSGDPAAVGRFEREIAALAALHHPNTVRVFDYGVTEAGVPFFAMELLFGKNLEQEIRGAGPLPADRALAIVRQVASALGEAHAKGIVHRDVKPGNVMLVDDTDGADHAKLLDFGIARSVDVEEGLTRAGSVVGTPTYLAPEVVLGRPADPRADVYGLGATLFYLLAGRPPFEGATASVLEAHREQPAPTLAAIGVDVPPEVEAIVARCLAKSPSARFADGAAVAQAISGGAGRRVGLALKVPPLLFSSETVSIDTPVPALRSPA